MSVDYCWCYFLCSKIFDDILVGAFSALYIKVCKSRSDTVVSIVNDFKVFDASNLDLHNKR